MTRGMQINSFRAAALAWVKTGVYNHQEEGWEMGDKPICLQLGPGRYQIRIKDGWDWDWEIVSIPPEGYQIKKHYEECDEVAEINGWHKGNY